MHISEKKNLRVIARSESVVNTTTLFGRVLVTTELGCQWYPVYFEISSQDKLLLNPYSFKCPLNTDFVKDELTNDFVFCSSKRKSKERKLFLFSKR